jgi:threonine synthase
MEYKEFKSGILDTLKAKISERLEAKKQELSQNFFKGNCEECDSSIEEETKNNADVACGEVIKSIKGKLPTKPEDLVSFDKAITAAAKKYKMSVDDLASLVQTKITKK